MEARSIGRSSSPQLNMGTHSRKAYYTTPLGAFYIGPCEKVLRLPTLKALKGKVQLILTSPPFPLNRKKKYGNLQGAEYAAWLASFSPLFREYLKPDGSVVVEVGNAWMTGSPVTSTLPYEALLAFKERGGFSLCQEFICFNPARLPTPAQWVTLERIRVKDAFTRLWWFGMNERPKADNRRVLVDYSLDMKKLLRYGSYNSGKRPSEHVIGAKSFLKDNRGAIPPNLIVAANTRAKDAYLDYCRTQKILLHPARMPESVAAFFVRFLSEEGDTVLDPFAGSNTTGAVAEKHGRHWIAIEPNRDYAAGSLGWFDRDSVHGPRGA